MTASDDSARDDLPRDEPEQDVPERDEPDTGAKHDLPFDEEAAWRSIVENYGERPQMGSDPGSPPAGPAARPDRRGPSSFDRSYLDALDAGPLPSEPFRPSPQPPEGGSRDAVDLPGRHDDEHFVPPEPPPVPRATPARRIAWVSLFGAPLMMLLAVMFGWEYPTWASFGLVVAFVGGFVFLVATMPRDGGDGWDDGAVV